MVVMEPRALKGDYHTQQTPEGALKGMYLLKYIPEGPDGGSAQIRDGSNTDFPSGPL